MARKNNLFASFPVFLAFLCMGFGDVVGPLTGLIKEEFQLSNFMAQMIPFMGFLMFGVLSIPLGIAQDRFGRRSILSAGLIIALLGLSIPYINGFDAFGAILMGILLLGAGASFLQVSGNPLMRDVSDEGKYSRNLSLGQFVKAIGSLSGALIPLAAVNYWGKDWKILFPVYSMVLLLTAIWMLSTRVVEKNREKQVLATFSSCLSLLKNPFVLAMVTGIFLYVGAEVSLSSGLPIFLQDSFQVDLQRFGLLGTLFFFIALTLGRFAGAMILNWISPLMFLKLSVAVALSGFAGLFFGTQSLAIAGIFLIGLGFANIFPLIFSITVDRFPDRGNELSGLMVTAIVGGALIPLVMGLVADQINTRFALIVPLVCTLYILTVAFSRKSKKTAAA
jgi:fucose permease